MRRDKQVKRKTKNCKKKDKGPWTSQIEAYGRSSQAARRGKLELKEGQMKIIGGRQTQGGKKRKQLDPPEV